MEPFLSIINAEEQQNLLERWQTGTKAQAVTWFWLQTDRCREGPAKWQRSIFILIFLLVFLPVDLLADTYTRTCMSRKNDSSV